jgi:hypothetical protein
MPTLDSTSLNTSSGNVQTRDQRVQHQHEDWYGRKWDGTKWAHQAPFDPRNNPQTGYWHNWYGDAEKIVGETFKRAIEVSLGVAHDNTMLDFERLMRTKTRTWTIDILSRCPAPWFEGWVTWRGQPATGTPAHPSTNGHVTVHLLTPSHEHATLLTSPLRPGNQTPEYRDEINSPPLPSYGERGMWVIAHEIQERVPFPAPTSNGPNSTANNLQPWTVPMFGGLVHSHGEVVAVQPNEPNGGVLPGGRPYT